MQLRNAPVPAPVRLFSPRPWRPAQAAVLGCLVAAAVLRRAALWGVLASLLGGCIDKGAAYVLTGPVHTDQICVATLAQGLSGAPPMTPASPTDTPPAQDGVVPGACPECTASRTDAGLCPDRYYTAAARCATDADCGGATCQHAYCVFHDQDGNGIDDDFQLEVARKNLPELHFHPDEECATPRGIITRVRWHPDAPRRLALTYVVLYGRDCGDLNGHAGDNESFAVTVDLDAQPGPAATVGVFTSAHRNTACDSESSCETAPGTRLCAPPRGDHVVIYSSRNKHAHYLDRDVCDRNCFDRCGDDLKPPQPALLDVGQEASPLVTNLTTAGFVLAADGWDPSLLDYDPWSPGVFGGAGHVREQLRDVIAPAGLPSTGESSPASGSAPGGSGSEATDGPIWVENPQ